MLKNKSNEIGQLKERIVELEKQLNEVANNSGNVIIKQLPNGQIELNGETIDTNSPVEYYNSASATFGEITMFRVGKEVTEREMKKLILQHADTVDGCNNHINSLSKEIEKLTLQRNNIITLHDSANNEVNRLCDNIKEITKTKDSEILELNDKLNETICRYDKMIELLNIDINNWKLRYLELNNITLDGTINTKYGSITS